VLQNNNAIENTTGVLSVTENTTGVLNVSSPFNDEFSGACPVDVGVNQNSCWQSSWPLGNKFPVEVRAAKQQRGDVAFRKTFPLSHL